MATFNPADFRSLSVPDRMALVEAIWDSIAEDREQLPVTEEQREELDRRLADMEANPDDGLSWEQVEAQLKNRP